MSETQTILVQEITKLRAVSYLFAVLAYLQDDPLCGKCTAFTNVFEQSMEKFIAIEKTLRRNRDIPEEMRGLLSGIYRVLSNLKMPDNPVRQKKEGNCGFPAGICMAKNTLGIYEQFDEEHKEQRSIEKEVN